MRGFTLVELLVVVAIIGLLATIIMVNVGGTKANSRDAKRTEDITSIRNALSLYTNDMSGYPIQATEGSAANLATALIPVYMSTMPTDPVNNGACNPITPNTYCYQSDGKTYNLKFCLETDSVNNYSAGCHTLKP